MDKERAFENLKNIYSGIGKQNLYEANEAETRLLVIDKVLSLLGWDEECFHPESKTYSGQYLDYLLTDNNVPRLIVEAKRIGATFNASQNLKKNTYKLGYIRSAFTRPFSDALEQTRRYAVETRVPFAVITNGIDWVVVNLLPKPGVSIDDQKCFFFSNVVADGGNFDQFWNLLSRVAISNGDLEEEFSIQNPSETEYSVYPRVVLGELKWNLLDDDEFVPEFYNFFFDEIVDSRRRRMLEMCFVTNTRLDQYEGELKRALQDTSPEYMEGAQELSPGEQSRLVGKTADQKGRVILVVGSVGAGKSTFLTKVRVDFRKHPVNFVYVDLINEITSIDHDVDELWRLACGEWRRSYPESTKYEELKQVFHSDLEVLRNGPKARLFEIDEAEYVREEAERLTEWSSKPEVFLRKSWQYQIRELKHIVLVLDNVDRASEEYQRLVYAFAHKIADDTGASVIVTMREGTYFRAKEGGFLDVRSNDLVFHLQSPNVTQILSKRIQYIEKYIESDFRAKHWKQIYEWSEFVEKARDYASVLKKSFLHDKDGIVTSEILAAVSWHNVRKFLNLLKKIHISLSGLKNGWKPNYVIGALSISSGHDFLKEIPTNIFEPTHPRQRSFFLKIRLLIALAFGFSDSERRRGISHNRLLQFAHSYGYRDAWVQSALMTLVRSRLIECMEVPSEEDFTKEYLVSDKHSFRVSPLGALMLLKLTGSTVYLTIAAWDIPFYREEWLKRFVNEFDALPVNASSIEPSDIDEIGNVNMAETILSYLKNCLKYECIMSPSMKSYSEVAIVEDWIAKFLHEDSTQRHSKLNIQELSDVGQLPLWQMYPEDDAPSESILIKPPKNIQELKVNGSSALPKIFWALVYLHVNGIKSATGSELTRVINQYVLDDRQPVEPTNISRALRSKVLQSQTWLLDSNKGGKRLFSLKTGWEREWKKVFGNDFEGTS